MPPDLAPFLNLRRRLRIAHHVPGRIRLKLAGLSLAELRNLDPKPFAGFLAGIEAVRSVRVNAAALSAVVDYDPASMAMEDWTLLLAGTTQEVDAVLARIGPSGEPAKDGKRMRIHVE